MGAAFETAAFAAAGRGVAVTTALGVAELTSAVAVAELPTAATPLTARPRTAAPWAAGPDADEVLVPGPRLVAVPSAAAHGVSRAGPMPRSTAAAPM
jgi:hypothetical protein